MRHLGVDLHKTMFLECVLEQGKKEFKKYDMKDLASFKSSLRKSDVVAVEATQATRAILSNRSKAWLRKSWWSIQRSFG